MTMPHVTSSTTGDLTDLIGRSADGSRVLLSTERASAVPASDLARVKEHLDVLGRLLFPLELVGRLVAVLGGLEGVVDGLEIDDDAAVSGDDVKLALRVAREVLTITHPETVETFVRAVSRGMESDGEGAVQ